jgi:hypothetical protein
MSKKSKKVKKNQKLQNKKEKNYPSQTATTTSPVVSSYDFFDEIYTLASPGIRTVTFNLARSLLTTTPYNHF